MARAMSAGVRLESGVVQHDGQQSQLRHHSSGM
jgi:hypothetical protein